MRYDRAFFQKTGYKVTDDRISDGPQPAKLRTYLEHFYEETHRPQRGTLAALRQAIAEFPDEPTLYNYLHTTLGLEKEDAEARRLLITILERFPDYTFGKIMLAQQRLDDQDIAGARRALGTTGDIRSFLPETEAIHISHFQAYHTLAGSIELKSGHLKAAKDHLRLLLQLDPKSKHAAVLGLDIFKEGPIQQLFDIRARQELLPGVVTKEPGKYTLTTGEPALRHPETAELLLLPYDYMPNRVQEQLLALPRASLVADLCALLEDSIVRLPDHRQAERENMPGNPAVHALAHLARLQADAALPMVLDTLHEPVAYQEFWFGDMADRYYGWYLVAVAERNLDAFQEFARTRNRYWFNKSPISRAVAQMGLHWPALRPQAVAWFADLFGYLLDHETDRDLIDAQFITFAVMEATDLRAAELLPLIRALDQKGWIDEQVMGDLADIEAELNRAPDPGDIRPLPVDLNDFYTEAYLKRRVASNRPPLQLPDDENDPVEQHLLMLTRKILGDFAVSGEEEAEEEDGYWVPRTKPIETVQRSTPKVGRNEPCPCGSGKKYKRCHGKDA